MKLADITGNRQIVQTLGKALAGGKLAHAYLFHGPRGVGKRTAALALARAYLCWQRVNGDCCGQCPACRKVLSGSHPDLHVFRPTGTTVKIEQIRELQKTLYLKPYEGSTKVYLLEEADTMTAEAANSLLKSLEEPPENTLLIFIATNLYSVLPTILSRCQAMHFKKIPQGEIENWLVSEKGVRREEARFLAALADGNLAKAIQWSDSEDARLARDGLIKLACRLRKGALYEVFKLSEEWEKKKDEIISLLDMLAIWYRDMLLWQQTGQEDLLVNIDCLDMIRKENDLWNDLELIKILETIEETKKALRSNGNLRLVLDQLFLTLQKPLGNGTLRRTS